MGIDRASADAVQAFEFTGSPEVVALDPQVQTAQWENKGDEGRRRKRNDAQREDSCNSLLADVLNAKGGPAPVVFDIPLAALANNMLNVRLRSPLALKSVQLPGSGSNLRENFIDAVDVTRISCEQVFKMPYVDSRPKTKSDFVPERPFHTGG